MTDEAPRHLPVQNSKSGAASPWTRRASPSDASRPGHHAYGGRDDSAEQHEGLPPGAAETVSSAAEFHEDQQASTRSWRFSRLGCEALTLVSRHTQLWFSVYLGDLGGGLAS